MTKSDDYHGLSERQRKAIPFLVVAPTGEDGCKRAKISRNSYYAWLLDPALKTALKKAQNDATEEAMNKAATALIGLLETTKTEALRRAVALDILNAGMKAVELSDLQDRLEKIELMALPPVEFAYFHFLLLPVLVLP